MPVDPRGPVGRAVGRHVVDDVVPGAGLDTVGMILETEDQ